MKKLLIVLTFVLLSTALSAQKYCHVSNMKTETYDGKEWAFYQDDELGVFFTHSTYRNNGKWHKIGVYIENYTDQRITFVPCDDVKALAIDKEGEEDNLGVFDYERFIRRTINRNFFGAMMWDLAIVVTAATDNYNLVEAVDYAAHVTQLVQDIKMCPQYIDELLGPSKIDSKSALSGYFLVKRNLENLLYLDVDVNGTIFHFCWEIDGRKSKILLPKSKK